MGGRIRILNIGINTYKNNSWLENLRYCVNDAELIHKGYSNWNPIFNKRLSDGEADKLSILKSFKDILNGIRDEDYIIISFSGHGLTTESDPEKIKAENTFICPYDFEGDYWEQTGISISEINRILKQTKANWLLILDCCNSGGALRRDFSKFKLREVDIQRFIDLIPVSKGNAILTSCDSNEKALELEDIKHGLFTHELIQMLKREDPSIQTLPIMEVYDEVSKKVIEKSGGKQHPKIKCSDDKFEIPIILSVKTESKKINLDLSFIPNTTTPSFEYIDPGDLEKFKEVVIDLIQQRRYIELNDLIKDRIKKMHQYISNPQISLSSTDIKEVLSYYESCREYLKPLGILTEYILEHGDSRYIRNNLDLIFSFEGVTHGKGGTTAVIDVPLTLISEFLIKLSGMAYKHRDLGILKKFFTLTSSYYYGKAKPIIYDRRIWHPEIFHRDIEAYLNHILPVDKREDLYTASLLKDIAEINLLFDAYSMSDDSYDCFPIYVILKINTLEDIIQKLSDHEYVRFIEDLFGLKIQEFLSLMIERQKEVLSFRDISIVVRHQISESIGKLEVIEKEYWKI